MNHSPHSRPVRSALRARRVNRPSPWWPVAAAAVILTLFFAVGARAQVYYPRVGLSAAPDHYEQDIEITEGEPFTLYACIFGPEDGSPLAQPISSVSWVIHQVCCGSVVDVVDVVWNDEFEHEGNPIIGVTSTPTQCVDRDQVLLATITAVLHNPVVGGGLWAAGPHDASYDCEGGYALFQGMPVSIFVEGETTPTDDSTWGGLKATYR